MKRCPYGCIDYTCSQRPEPGEPCPLGFFLPDEESPTWGTIGYLFAALLVAGFSAALLVHFGWTTVMSVMLGCLAVYGCVSTYRRSRSRS